MSNLKHYIVPVLVFLSGIFLSVISAYYSILGLLSIFSGAVVLISLMGIGLELSKITACIWLHKHWQDKIGFLRYYLSISVVVLMIITSMGVYAFLTNSHLKQSDTVNLNTSKVTYLEETIKREQSKLDNNSVQINQYNTLLSKLVTDDVRRASNERRRIQTEIKKLNVEAKEITSTIDKLNIDLLPYKSEINKAEVEVGTLLYISQLFYGEDYKAHLPQVLTFLTLMIIFVFDPLAIGLLIASQKSFLFLEKNKNKITFTVPENTSALTIKSSGNGGKISGENMTKAKMELGSDDVEIHGGGNTKAHLESLNTPKAKELVQKIMDGRLTLNAPFPGQGIPWTNEKKRELDDVLSKHIINNKKVEPEYGESDISEEKYKEVVEHYSKNPIREATDEEVNEILDKDKNRMPKGYRQANNVNKEM